MLLILPLGGEGTWAVRTGSSIVMETPDFCWLMDLRVKVSPNVTFFTSCSTGGGKAASTDAWGGAGGSASGSFSSSSSLCPFSWPSAGTT